MNRLNWRWAMLLVFIGALVFSVSFTSGVGGPVSSALPGVDGEEPVQPPAQDTLAITRRLYEGPVLETDGIDVSPDGRHLAKIDWDTGDLVVFDLLTGQPRPVTDETFHGFAEMSAYSPDGKEIAFTSQNEDGEYEVWVIGVDGSSPRIILPPDLERWDWPGLCDWSPDGEHLLLDLWLGWDSEKLTLASVQDGSLRVLFDCRRDTQNASCGSAAFSPDGRYIAFDENSGPTSPDDADADTDVVLISLLGDGVVPLLTGPAEDRLLGWEPDGRGILFQSDRDLTEGVWRLSVIDGRPAGEPELIKGDLWHLDRIGVADGRVYYSLVTERPQLYTVGVDLEGGRILSPPTPVEETPEGEPTFWAWSPDGRRLAYLRSSSSGTEELVIRSLPGDPARIMPLPPIRWIQGLWWGAQGRGLVLASAGGSLENPGWRGLYHLDLETGAYSPIETSEGILAGATLTGDLKVVYYDPGGYPFSSWEGLSNALWAVNLETGHKREVARFSSPNRLGGFPALSPDERWVARFSVPVDEPNVRVVEVISTESGEVKELHRFESSPGHPPQCGAISWSPDGKHLVYGVPNPSSGGCTLQRLPVGGGDPTPIGDLPWFKAYGTPLNPLGTRLAFRHGESRGEIWVMEYGTPAQRSRAAPASRIGR